MSAPVPCVSRSWHSRRSDAPSPSADLVAVLDFIELLSLTGGACLDSALREAASAAGRLANRHSYAIRTAGDRNLILALMEIDETDGPLPGWIPPLEVTEEGDE